MVETEITCECNQITLPDLRISLTKGMVVYVDASRASLSKDLARAQKASGVKVRQVRRYRERRPEAVSAPSPVPSTPFVPPVVEIPKVEVDVNALAERVIELLAPRLEEMLGSAMMGLWDRPLPTSSGVPIVTQSKGALPQQVPDDIPVFIPSKVGRDDLKPVKVQSSESKDDGLADTLAALKAARKSEK